MSDSIDIREANRADHDELGSVTLRAYSALYGGVFPAADYADELRNVARRAADAVVLVATQTGRIVGGVCYVPGPGPMAEFDGEDTAGIRMLAVSPDLQARGIGARLLEACLVRARAAGKARVVLHSTPEMTAAHRLYARYGFVRQPALDFDHPPVKLMAFALSLGGASLTRQGRR
jgi:predicted N-acetyltransferase YhbS